MNGNTIVYFGNVLYPDLDAASHRTIGNAKALRKLGYRVVLIGTRKGESRPVLETKEVFAGFDIYYFADPQSGQQWRDYLFDIRPLEIVLGKLANVEAVILYNHPSISTKRTISYCHKRNIKVYADCTEWFDPQGISVHNIIKKIDTWYRMRVVNAKLDGVIAISSFLQNYYNKKDCKTICVPPLIDLTDAKWVKEGDINSDNERGAIKLCYVGNPGAGEKDKLNYILAALKRVSEEAHNIRILLNIVGMTAQQYMDVFKKDVSEYGFAKFLGRKPNTEALKIIKESDFSIFLRDTNLVCTAGFPTKFSESIACGTPVLTNLSSDLEKYLHEGENGFVLDITSEDTLVASLLKDLSETQDKRNHMKEYCRSEKTFDYNSFILEFAKFFRKI